MKKNELSAEPAAHERAMNQDVLTQHSGTLLGGMLLADEWGRKVTAFDPADGSDKVFFKVPDPEGGVIALVVIPQSH